MREQPRYQIYPSLLDKFAAYQRCGDVYDKYWGGMDEPPFSYEEFMARELQDLIDTINRVPKDLPRADVGTVFNELVDCIAGGYTSERLTVERVYRPAPMGDEVGWLRAHYNGRSFVYPIELCREFADYYRSDEAIAQMFVEGEIDTPRGRVRLYGFADEVMSHSIHDIKTASQYEAFKYKGNAQHLVYPYCLHQMGMPITTFYYDVAHIKTNIKGEDTPEEIIIEAIGTYQEKYIYIAERDEAILRERLCDLIDFLEAHRDQITHRKVFGL